MTETQAREAAGAIRAIAAACRDAGVVMARVSTPEASIDITLGGPPVLDLPAASVAAANDAARAGEHDDDELLFASAGDR